jgi:small subunit ribosomal protein S17
MNDEEKNEKQQEEEKAPEAEAEETPQDDASEQDDASKEVDAPAGDATEEASADEGGGSEDASPDDDDEIDWKARRRLERSRLSGEAGPQRSPEDRAKERGERRGRAARSRSAYRKKQRTKRERGEGTSPAERSPIGAKTRQGRVVSSKPDKTITVAIDIVRRHPHYEKIVRRSRTLHAHDAQNEANEGDLVRVVETRPLSRTKRWRLVEILEKAQ